LKVSEVGEWGEREGGRGKGRQGVVLRATFAVCPEGLAKRGGREM